MGVTLSINHPDLSFRERTYINTDYTSGTNLVVRNNNNVTTSWFVVVGEPGQERTEIQQITGTTGTGTITLNAALSFSHPAGTPVYITKWDKVAVEWASASGGTFAAISESPIALGWDNHILATVVTHVAGITSYYYKYRYYNSVLGSDEYSTYSGEIPGTGLAKDSAGYAIWQIKKNPDAENIDDETIYSYFIDFNEMIAADIPKAWWLTKTGTDASTVADTYTYSISGNWSDFISMDVLLYNYVSGSNSNIAPLTFATRTEFYNYKADQNQSSSDTAKYWTLLPPDSSSAKGYIGIHPTPKTTACALRPIYYYDLSDIDSMDDTLVVPSTKAYVDYGLYRIYDDILRDQTNADKYIARVRGDTDLLKRRSKRQLGQPEFNRYRGQRGFSKMFGGSGSTSSDYYRENYW